MALPVILAVDYVILAGRSDIERELLDRYSRSYTVVCVASATDARSHLSELRARGEAVEVGRRSGDRRDD